MTVLTKKKISEIVKEIDELNSSREELIIQLNEAMRFGDLSENAEYIETKKKINRKRYKVIKVK